ncbi:MAG: regulatory iron-sulfur-containing complex subunit RicT [Bacilli bacterium]
MMDIRIVGIRFDEERLTYCSFSDEINIGDLAVVDLEGFPFAGTVEKVRFAREDENLEIYDRIIKVASQEDKNNYQDILKKDIRLVGEIQKEADALNLSMTVFRVTSSLDNSKIKVMYTADDRVDFRNLLKILASKLHARLELRQVGPRDRAKMVGGIGICGRPLCCSSFLNTFDIISISMAKNQMLSINIPKLSGQCGKLICCLKYENETYTKEKEGFPKLGSVVKYENRNMKIINMNVLNKTLTISDKESRLNLTLDEFNRLINKERKTNNNLSNNMINERKTTVSNNRNSGENKNKNGNTNRRKDRGKKHTRNFSKERRRNDNKK